MPTGLRGDVMLTKDQLEDFTTDGWLMIEGMIESAEAAAAAEELMALGFPERRVFEPSVAQSGSDQTAFESMTTFPFRSSAANRITTSEALRAACAQVLDGARVQLFQSQAWLKKGGQALYEQDHHRDYPKNTMLTPRDDRGSVDFVSFIVYLTDVTGSCGPTAFASLSRSRHRSLEPSRLSLSVAPELYEIERTATGPRGTVLLYTGDVFHRATELEPRSSRLVIKGAVRRSDAPWVGYVHGLRVGFEPEWSDFVRQATRDQLSFVFGSDDVGRFNLAASDRYLG